MNILITGATGYLGGCLASYLKKDKDFNITTCSSSYEENFNDKHLKIDWVNKNSVKQACNDKDIIIHCASPNAKESELKPKSVYEFNSIILDQFINQAINSNVKKFIYFSSAHIYNSPLTGHLSELTPLNPTHPYGISKKIAEETLLKYNKKDFFEVTIIRLSNAFGTPCNQKINPWSLVVNDFCKQAVETRKIKINAATNQTRNFVPIIEIVHLLRFVIDKYSKYQSLPSIFNFGGQWNLNLVQLAQKIASVYYEWKGEKISILFNDELKKQSHKLEYNFDIIKKEGFIPKSDYSIQIKKLFEDLTKE